jgi:hypothetical protein
LLSLTGALAIPDTEAMDDETTSSDTSSSTLTLGGTGSRDWQGAESGTGQGAGQGGERGHGIGAGQGAEGGTGQGAGQGGEGGIGSGKPVGGGKGSQTYESGIHKSLAVGKGWTIGDGHGTIRNKGSRAAKASARHEARHEASSRWVSTEWDRWAGRVQGFITELEASVTQITEARFAAVEEARVAQAELKASVTRVEVQEFFLFIDSG